MIYWQYFPDLRNLPQLFGQPRHHSIWAYHRRWTPEACHCSDSGFNMRILFKNSSSVRSNTFIVCSCSTYIVMMFLLFHSPTHFLLPSSSLLPHFFLFSSSLLPHFFLSSSSSFSAFVPLSTPLLISSLHLRALSTDFAVSTLSDLNTLSLSILSCVFKALILYIIYTYLITAGEIFLHWICFWSADDFLIDYLRPSNNYALLIRARTEVGIGDILSINARTLDISELFQKTCRPII